MVNETEIIDSLEKFLKGSKTFRGICFDEIPSMSNNVFLIAFKEFLKTKNNYLDEFVTLFNLDQILFRNYSLEELRTLSIKKLSEYKKILNNKGFWDVNFLYSKTQVKQLLKKIDLIEKGREECQIE